MKFCGKKAFPLLCLLGAASAPAATYHVSASSGDDGNPGSESSPWKTLGKAARTLVAGDTVLVGPGRYVDAGSDAFRAFNPANSGTEGAPIVFKSLRLHEAELAGRSDHHPAFSTNARKHIVVDGFKVAGGIGVRQNSDYSVIRNCHVTRGFIQEGDVSLDWGMYISGSSHCVFENNRVDGLAGLGNKRRNSTGLMVIGQPAPATDNLIQNNEIDAGGAVYSAFGQKAGQTHRNVWRRNIARNGVAGYYGMGSTSNQWYSEDNVYYENIAVNCKNAFEQNHNCSRFLIYNNAAYGGENFLYGGDRNDGYSGNTANQVWNNIFSSASPTSAFYRRDHGPINWKQFIAFSDHNNFHGARVAAWNYTQSAHATLAAWQGATSFDGNSQASDPAFVSPQAGDFHLLPDSPSRHRGLDRGGKSPGYEGGAPDQGAYPRGSDGTRIGVITGGQIPGKTKPRPPVNLPAKNYDPIPD